MARFWVQTRTPAGGWADDLGSDDKSRALDHARALAPGMASIRIAVRVVEREDVEVWASTAEP